ncbi:MAG: helix-turn-helix domain-containing protein [Pseudonocardiaceae bacterium]
MDTGGLHLLTEATVAGSNPTVRMRQLGMELRRLREAARKTQAQAGHWLNLGETAISKMETGDRKVKVGYVKALCQLYDVDAPHAGFLERLARESDQRGWWADYGNTVPSWFKDFLGMETAAAEVWTYESEYIPGLLQTQEYVEAMAKGTAPGDAERFSKLRATRQNRLVDNDPLTLRAVLNEAVLLRPVGGPDVMRRQLRHVIETATLPNVTVQVLPFSVGFHPAMAGSFTALRFPESPMNTVYVEIKGGAIYMEKPPDVERYTAIFERLAELALSGEETVSLLEQVERRYSS